MIHLGSAFKIFGTFYVIYGLSLTMYKNYINADFDKAQYGKRFQHIIDTLNVPEAFGDFDDDNTLDVKGHLQKWKNILTEMLVMALFQFLSNMAMMVPLIITGIYFYMQIACLARF